MRQRIRAQMLVGCVGSHPNATRHLAFISEHVEPKHAIDQECLHYERVPQFDLCDMIDTKFVDPTIISSQGFNPFGPRRAWFQSRRSGVMHKVHVFGRVDMPILILIRVTNRICKIHAKHACFGLGIFREWRTLIKRQLWRLCKSVSRPLWVKK